MKNGLLSIFVDSRQLTRIRKNPMRIERSWVVRYGMAAASVIVVVLVKFLLGKFFADQAPFLLMPLAILVTAWYAGRAAALVATVLASIAVGYFFISPPFSYQIGLPGFFQLLVFIAEGVLLALFGASRKEALVEVARRERILGVTLSSIGDAVIATDVAGNITFLNPIAEKLTGWRKEEGGSLPLSTVFRIINEETRESVENPVDQVLREGKAVGLANHTVLLSRNGREIPIEDSAAPIRDMDGSVLGVILVFHDVSERRRAEIEREFQVKATERLASSLDYTKTLAEVADLAVPHIADWCAVDMLDADGRLGRVAVAHKDPEKVRWALELEREYPVDPDAPTGVPNVIRTDRSEFYPLITDEFLVAIAKDEAQLKLLREIGFTSAMVVPLRAGGNAIGAITFVSTESGKEFTSEDLALAEDLAQRASTAIDNAILHRQIAEQREWLRVTIASIGDAVIATDTGGLVTFMNAIAENLTGWKIGAAIGRSLSEVFDIVNEETGAVAENPVDRVLKEGVIVGLANHTVLIARDGTRCPIEDSAAPIIGGNGELRGVVMVFHDVTEQRTAEYALRESEERFRSLADSVPVLIWMSDASAGATYFNRSWLDFVGHTIEQELGEGWSMSVHPEDRSRRMDAFHAAFEERAPFNVEYRLRRADGVYRWVMDNGIPRFDPDGAFIGYLGSGIDITDRMMAETELLRAKEEAEAASRAKDQFIAVLSHELRTPLTPVLAMVHSLESDHQLSNDLRGYFEIIRRNVELEARLIDDLLDLTRITKGKLQLNFETVDAHALMRNVLEICRSETQAKQIKLITNFSALHHMVRVDSARLQQVYWNLVKNAVKFTPEGGTISVVSSNGPHGGLTMSVSDTGIGIEPEIMPRIFEAFEQGEQTITRHFGGLGLGLSISKALVDAHHGTLIAFSEGKGKGATFTVTLPTGLEQTLPASPVIEDRGPEVRSMGPVRILVVDDHVDTVTVTKMLLERAGFEILSANSIREALAIAKREKFDLLISDIGLPDGSGVDLMRALSRERPIKGIAISGFGMEEDVIRSREAGFLDHLTKPMNFQKLKSSIDRILSEE